MKQITLIILMSAIVALCGCTTEKTPEPQQQIPALTLSSADKEKLLVFRKEILNIENLTDKAVKLAVDELKNVINDGRTGLIAAYKAYAESFEAIKSFVADKNPMALLEYRKKNTQAQELYDAAAAKLKTVMTAAGVSQ